MWLLADLMTFSVPVLLVAPILTGMVVAVKWLAGRNAECEKSNESRHQEVLQLTREVLTTVAQLRDAIKDIAHEPKD